MWTTLCPKQWVWILPVGLDFVSWSGFCQWVWICQWVCIWKPHGPDSLLYHVIFTQPWHNPFLVGTPSVMCYLTKQSTANWSICITSIYVYGHWLHMLKTCSGSHRMDNCITGFYYTYNQPKQPVWLFTPLYSGGSERTLLWLRESHGGVSNNPTLIEGDVGCLWAICLTC